MEATNIDINHPAHGHLEHKETSIQVSARADIELPDSAAETTSNVPLSNIDGCLHISTFSHENQESKNSLEHSNDKRNTSNKVLRNNMLVNEISCNALLSLPRSLNSGNVLEGDNSYVEKTSGIKHTKTSIHDTDKNKIEVEHQQVQYMKSVTQKAVKMEVASSDSNRFLKRNSCLKQITNEGTAHELDYKEAAQEQKDIFSVEFLQDLDKSNASLPERTEKCMDKRKGKMIIYTSGGSSLMEQKGKPESVESNSYKQLLFVGKRSPAFQSDGNPGSSKRLKKVSDEVICSGPFPMEGRSFSNWMTDIAQSYPNVEPKSRNKNIVNASLLLSSDTNEHFNNLNTCFQPFAPPLYHSGMKSLQQTISGTDIHIHEPGNYKELQVAKLPSGGDCRQIINKNGFKLESLSGNKVDQCQPGEFPPTPIPRSDTDRLPTLKRSNCISNENHELYHLDPTSLLRDNPITANTRCSSAAVSCNNGQYLRSFWITRLRQKTALKINETCNKKVIPSTKMVVSNTTGCLPLCRDDSMPVTSADQMENISNFILEDGKNAPTSMSQYITPSGSCIPKGIYTDHDPKSKFNPIVSSQRLRKPKPMASIFAKRLGALRHIKVSAVVDDLMLPTSCFYCGRGGHNLNECAEIADSERDDLLGNFNSFAKPQNASCFCIRCFRLTHWAIACPHAPTKIEQSSHGSVVRMNIVHSEPEKAPNHVANICTDKTEISGQTKDSFENLCSTTSSFNVEQFCVTNPRNEEINMVFDSKPSGDNVASCSKKHMIHITPFADSNTELKTKHALSEQNSAIKRMSQEQGRIFDRIRGLRLSRTDLSSGIKSPLVSSCLKGFFLRVRLGKWKEGNGGTGYHVACITGPPPGKLHERCQIQVSIGGLELSLDCRFVSNHDFIEDELHAWWTQTMRNGGKLPSEEEFTRKLQERRDFSL